MDDFDIPRGLAEPIPLVPVFEFSGVRKNGKIAFALVTVAVPPEDKNMGTFTAFLYIPLRLDDQATLASIGDWSIDLARRTMNLPSALAYLAGPGSPPASGAPQQSA